MPRTGISPKNACAPAIDSSTTSPMLRPCTVTASDSGLSRRPAQVEHGVAIMYSSSSMRIASLDVSS